MQSKKSPGKKDLKGKTVKPSEDFTAAIFQVAEAELNAKLYPSTKTLIKNIIKKGISNNLIRNDTEKIFVTASLTASSIDFVKKKGIQTVKPGDVLENWNENISMGPGNCPPHRCMRRSIIDRYDTMSTQYSGIERIINNLKNID